MSIRKYLKLFQICSLSIYWVVYQIGHVDQVQAWNLETVCNIRTHKHTHHCIHIYTNAHIYTPMHTHTTAHIHTPLHTHTLLHIYKPLHIYTTAHAYLCMYDLPQSRTGYLTQPSISHLLVQWYSQTSHLERCPSHRRIWNREWMDE